MFNEKQGLPSKRIERIEADTDGRIYVVGQPQNQISRQIAQFSGGRFIQYSVEILETILSQSPASRTENLKAMGFLDTYQKEINLKNASQALKIFDKADTGAEITAILGTPHYLLMGTKSGNLIIFDGESFKPLSEKGTGRLGEIIGLKLRPDNSIVIFGSDRGVIFDGEQFEGVAPVGGSDGKIVDITLDDMNPYLFWVAFQASGGGGIALYEKPHWNVVQTTTEEQPQFIAICDPFIFWATKNKVYKAMKRG